MTTATSSTDTRLKPAAYKDFLTLDMAKTQVESMRHAVTAAEGRLREASAVQRRTERGFREEDIASAHADVTLAQGELDEAEARYAEREVRVPTAVIIEAMDIRPGDLFLPNAPLAKVLEADQLYVMVYVPQTEVGKCTLATKPRLLSTAFQTEASRREWHRFASKLASPSQTGIQIP